MYKCEIYVRSGDRFPTAPQFVYTGKPDVLQKLSADLEHQLFSDPPPARSARRDLGPLSVTFTFQTDYMRTVYTVPA